MGKETDPQERAALEQKVADMVQQSKMLETYLNDILTREFAGKRGKVFISCIRYNSWMFLRRKPSLLQGKFWVSTNSLQAKFDVILFNVAILLQLLTKFFMAFTSSMG